MSGRGLYLLGVSSVVLQGEKSTQLRAGGSRPRGRGGSGKAVLQRGRRSWNLIEVAIGKGSGNTGHANE